MTDLGNIYPFPMTSWHLQEYLMSGFFSQTSTFTTSFLSSSEEFSPTSSPTKHKEATILHNHQRQFKICSIVKYFNDCSVKILPSSSSPIEKTFAMFLYLLPTRSVLLTCLLRTITKQNMNYMYKFCPNMYLISVKRHFHSIWTHQTFNAFQQYWFWILKIIYYQTDKCISCYMYNHFHILWELNKIRQVLWSYLSYLLDGDIKGLTFLVFGVHSLYNLLAFASSQLTCFWQ